MGSPLRAAGDSLRIALDASVESGALMKDTLPDAMLVPIEDMDEQNRLLETGAMAIDAIADMA